MEEKEEVNKSENKWRKRRGRGGVKAREADLIELMVIHFIAGGWSPCHASPCCQGSSGYSFPTEQGWQLVGTGECLSTDEWFSAADTETFLSSVLLMKSPSFRRTDYPPTLEALELQIALSLAEERTTTNSPCIGGCCLWSASLPPHSSTNPLSP